MTAVEYTGWYPVASVWIQEWFDEELPSRIRVLGHSKPYDGVVEFPSSLPDQEGKSLRGEHQVFAAAWRMQSRWCVATPDSSLVWSKLGLNL